MRSRCRIAPTAVAASRQHADGGPLKRTGHFSPIAAGQASHLGHPWRRQGQCRGKRAADGTGSACGLQGGHGHHHLAGRRLREKHHVARVKRSPEDALPSRKAARYRRRTRLSVAPLCWPADGHMAAWCHAVCVCVCGPPPQHDRHSVPSKVLRRLACSRKLCPSFGPAAKEVRQARDPRE